jgi:hypothetical protein
MYARVCVCVCVCMCVYVHVCVCVSVCGCIWQDVANLCFCPQLLQLLPVLVSSDEFKISLCLTLDTPTIYYGRQ